jgi:hypothetical protein
MVAIIPAMIQWWHPPLPASILGGPSVRFGHQKYLTHHSNGQQMPGCRRITFCPFPDPCHLFWPNESHFGEEEWKVVK